MIVNMEYEEQKKNCVHSNKIKSSRKILLQNVNCELSLKIISAQQKSTVKNEKPE